MRSRNDKQQQVLGGKPLEEGLEEDRNGSSGGSGKSRFPHIPILRQASTNLTINVSINIFNLETWYVMIVVYNFIVVHWQVLVIGC